MITIFISFVLIGLFIFLVLKDRKTPGYFVPTLIRSIILLLLILITVAHIFRFSYTQKPKIPVLVLVDASKSIKVGDNFNQIKQVIDKIKQNQFRAKFYSFSDSIGPLHNYAQASGERTDIGKALRFAQNQRPGAVILITDGQHNTKTNPFSILDDIQAPIYTIGIGSEQKSDIAISSIRKPLRSFLGDTIEIVARIYNKGFENYQTKVNLLKKGKTIQSQNITFSGSDVIQEINFKVLSDSIGKITYSIRIDTLPNEATINNNRKDFSIELLKSRWQIIYLTNAPSFNTRFIITALQYSNSVEETNKFTVIPMIGFVDKNIQNPKDITLAQAFRDADAIILDDINETNLTNEVIIQLNNFIEQGKGILLLSGENFRPANIITKISPFEFNGLSFDRTNIFIELTEAGSMNPLFYNETGDYLLDNTPPLFGQNTKITTKPDAAVWAISKDNKTPLIGFQQYNRSKVIMITGFPVWRWGFSSFQTEQTKQNFEQFLKNLVRFLAIKDFEQFKLLTNKPDYLAGEDIIFNLLATTPDARNWTDLDVKLKLSKEQILIPMYEQSPGNYQCEIKALAAGEYEATAIISKDNKQIGTAKTSYTITQQSIEDFTGLNSDLLIKLSNKNEGKYYTTEQFLNETFLPKIIKYRRTLSFTFHNNWYIYILVTILFGITLYLRKKRGFL